MPLENVNYGQNDGLTALQVTTGMYPSTGVPLDIREKIKNSAITLSSEPVGCALYPGLQIYSEEDMEVLTVIGKIDGADGSRWNHWIFAKTNNLFKDAIDECHDSSYGSKYMAVNTNDYTIQNLLNYLFFRCNDEVHNPHKLTIRYIYSGSGSEAATPYESWIPYGNTFSVTSPVLAGYSCSQTVVNGTMPDEDLTITVTYSIQTYTLTYKLDANTVYATYTLEYNATVNPPEDPHGTEEYTFGHWVYTPALNGNKMPASDVIAMAYWEPVVHYYTVQANPMPAVGGTVTGSGSYAGGSTVYLTATPSSNYQFANWTENGSTVSTSASYTITDLSRDMSLVANFTKNRFRINVDKLTSPTSENGGAVSGGGEYNAGSTVTVTATKYTGYRFAGWYEGDTLVSQTSTYSFAASEDRNLVAHFIKQMKISIDIVPSGAGSVAHPELVDYDADLTLTAIPASGSGFVGWTDLDSGTSLGTTTTITIEHVRTDKNIRAQFIGTTGVNVYAWLLSSTPTATTLSGTVLNNSIPHVSVDSTDISEIYYVNVPYEWTPNDDGKVWLAVAMPWNFESGEIAGGVGTFFKVHSTGDTIQNKPDQASASKSVGGVTYKIVASRWFDISTSTGSSYDVLFGNVTGTSWSTEREKAIEISLQ